MFVASNNPMEASTVVVYFSVRIIETVGGGVLSVLVMITFRTNRSRTTLIG